MIMLAVKRVYEPPAEDDGFRVLVDRLWPRGISKEKARLDLWLKDVAPSNELRKWFGHDPVKWDEFRKKYLEELQGNAEAVAELKQVVRENKKVTLLYGAKDDQHNQALVLQEYLKRK